MTEVAPAQRRLQAPVTGRMELVGEKKARPNLQPNRAVSAQILGIVDAPSQRLIQVARQTVYVDRSTVEEEMLASSGAFARTQELMLHVSAELAKDKLPQPERIREAVGEMVQSMVRNPDAMVWLSKLKRSDNYSYDHALDVSIHLMAFGRHLGLPPDHLNILGVAGLLQDVGKASVPDGLLQKADALTPGERAVLRRHVEYSTQILATQAGLPPEVIQIAARHHERYDGSGYPRRLNGSDIGLNAEMAGLVDTYCAMSYDRPYRRGLDNEHVLRKLYASRGKRFAESLIVEFIQCIGLYPVGTLVELRTGEVAVVVEQNRVRRLKPRILVMLDKAKQHIESPLVLDLKEDPLAEDGTAYQIRHALEPGSHGIEPREFYL
jgi:HD-GYP domain-containing protein (c-di-GMP phosphodiesterase class II)